MWPKHRESLTGGLWPTCLEIRDGFSGGLADWTALCDTVDLGDEPGILIDDTLNINWNGNRKKIEGNMTGQPLFTQDTSITAESLMAVGDMGWDRHGGSGGHRIHR